MRLFIFSLVSILLLVGCRSAPKPIIATQHNEKAVEAPINVVRRSVIKIDKAADAAVAKAPVVEPEMKEIKVATGEIETETKTIENSYKELAANANKQTVVLTTENSKLKKEVVTLQDKSSVQQKKILSLIVIASGLWVGVSLMLFFLGKLPSATLTLIGGAVLISAIALQFITAYAMLIGGVAVGLMGIYVVYQMFIQKRAFVETIYTAEEAKKQIGNAKFAKIADEQQSKSTVLAVKQIRTKEGLSADSKKKEN